MIIIIFVLRSACMVWVVCYENFPSIFVFIQVLAEFIYFKITLITSFHVSSGLPCGKQPVNVKVVHLLDQVFFSILSRRLSYSSLLFPHTIQFYYSPKFLSRNSTLKPSMVHPSNYHCTFPIYSNHILLFNWPNFTSI